MCSSSPRTPAPVPVVQAKPAVVATAESTTPTLALNSVSRNLAKKRRGKKAFKQTKNVSGVNTPGTNGGGLSIPSTTT